MTVLVVIEAMGIMMIVLLVMSVLVSLLCSQDDSVVSGAEGDGAGVIRDLTKPRRRRQRERQKNNRCNEPNNNSARASRFFCTFLCLHCTTTTLNDQILSLLGNGNGKAINCTISA